MKHRALAAPLAALSLGIAAAAYAQLGIPNSPNQPRVALRSYATPYYTLNTDLPESDAREADLRITRMFEEYQKRTAAFAQPIRVKFPFFLYRNESDYLAAGGPKRSVGVYIEDHNGKRLMAVAGQRTSDDTWHVVQHEGFHQFMANAMPNGLPVWVDEGMAEYFGEAMFTGDGFVTGLIPPDRLDEIKTAIKSNRFKPFKDIMTMTAEQWGDKLEYSNYNQAWAMVHFLVHGDDGKYQKAFENFMMQLSRRAPPNVAWDNAFGPNTGAGFEQRCEQWWVALPDNPTKIGYMQGIVQTAASFLGRAYIMKKAFPDAKTFFTTYDPPDSGLSRDLWLPPSLFKEISEVGADVGDWTLESTANQPPKLSCTDPDGNKYAATILVSAGKVAKVTVDLKKGPGPTTQIVH